ncbi:MAG: GTP cyclohydrolase, FolE2/MptA family [Candidatus Nasuia deltocephalinicola]
MIYKDIFLNKIKILNILNIKKIFVNKVGIKNLYYPFIFNNNKGKLNRSNGVWNVSVSLNKYKRGIHMSRIIYILNKLLLKPLNITYFCKFYRFFRSKMLSNDFFFQLSFIYFIKKISPVTNYKSFLNYKVTFLFEKINIFSNFILKIVVPLNSLCPCSKYVSIYNAHNQRIYVSLFISSKKKYININDIVNRVEKHSSISLWAILKRSDEKYFTEFSYKNPKFVEDLTRNLFFEFKNYKFFLKIENLESIHNHNVYSYIKKFF